MPDDTNTAGATADTTTGKAKSTTSTPTPAPVEAPVPRNFYKVLIGPLMLGPAKCLFGAKVNLTADQAKQVNDGQPGTLQYLGPVL